VRGRGDVECPGDEGEKPLFIWPSSSRALSFPPVDRDIKQAGCWRRAQKHTTAAFSQESQWNSNPEEDEEEADSSTASIRQHRSGALLTEKKENFGGARAYYMLASVSPGPNNDQPKLLHVTHG